MTSVKALFRKASPTAFSGSIHYRISHQRRIRLIAAGYNLNAADWDSARSGIAPDAALRSPSLQQLSVSIRSDLRRFDSIVTSFQARSRSYTADDIADAFMRYRRDCSLFGYMQRRIAALRLHSDTRTACNYIAAFNSFRRFRNGQDLMLDAISPALLKSYEDYLRRRGNIPNTTSFYMRTLRAVYNRAVDDELIADDKPFRRVYTGVDRTPKRALPLTELRRMCSLELAPDGREAFARDIFMLSFYLRGMSLIDMAFLLPSDLTRGCLTYRRHKTGRLIRIAWTSEMQRIVDRYPPNPLGYLLPIITRSDVSPRRVCLSVGNNVNYHLRKIAARLGIDSPLTLYCARHSWASVARGMGIPLGVISEGMGHESEATTRIYLSTLETTAVVDNANARIISALRS